MYYLSGETLWMLVSVLTLPPAEQERIIGGINSDKDDCSNHAVQFLTALQVYQNSFYDHFDFELKSEHKIYENFTHLLNGGDFQMDAYGFYHGEDWQTLRKLASELLKITELPVFEPIETINFEQFLEFVYDENGNLIGLN